MTARVRAVTPDQFSAWLDRQRQAIQQANAAAQQQRKRVDAGQSPGGG
jgi:heme/copper-type cytochrome/quinol oxidase subunit 2